MGWDGTDGDHEGPARVACDVGSEKITLLSRSVRSRRGRRMGDDEPDRCDHIDAHRDPRASPRTRDHCAEDRRRADRHLPQTAPPHRPLGFQTALVDAAHVKAMRSVVFGDDGNLPFGLIIPEHVASSCSEVSDPSSVALGDAR